MDPCPPPDTATIAVTRSERDGAVIETVASSLPSDLRCPHCGGERRANGRRIVRYRDIPVVRVPRFVNWRRQHYRCAVCSRASDEEHPAFEKDRFCTRRFSEWVVKKSATTTFVKLAKRAGMNPLVLRRLFHAETAAPSRSRAPPRALAIALVTLAGRPRPLVADAAGNRIIDVLASTDELMTHLAAMGRSATPGVACVIRDIELDTPELLSATRLTELMPGLRESGIDSCSLAQMGLALLVAKYDAWIKTVARLQGRSRADIRKSVAPAYDARAIAAALTSKWSNDEHASPRLDVENQIRWLAVEWGDPYTFNRRQAGTSPEQTWPKPDFEAVASFIAARSHEVLACYEDVDLVRTEQWLNTVRHHHIKRSHSFVAARIALLDRFGGSSSAGSKLIDATGWGASTT
jgi:rubredoxin